MNKILFLLGLIRSTKLHGYQISELLDSHFDLIINITKPTAYRLLGTMEAKGWIQFHEEQVGNRPPRKVYAITPAGEAHFQKILRQSLARFDPIGYSTAINLAFIDAIPQDEILPLLAERQQRVEVALARLNQIDAQQDHYRHVFAHQRRHFEAEIASITEIVKRIKTP